jgi:hypothetical protein
MPLVVSDKLVTWHSEFCGLLYGPPYLSTIACDTQTSRVCPPIDGMLGIPLILIWLVTSQRPAFRCPCALAAKAIKQQPTTIPIHVLFITSSSPRGNAGRAF